MAAPRPFWHTPRPFRGPVGRLTPKAPVGKFAWRRREDVSIPSHASWEFHRRPQWEDSFNNDAQN
eukprot:7681329-Pyramimonas_sp.AAC.1